MHERMIFITLSSYQYRFSFLFFMKENSTVISFGTPKHINSTGISFGTPKHIVLQFLFTSKLPFDMGLKTVGGYSSSFMYMRLPSGPSIYRYDFRSLFGILHLEHSSLVGSKTSDTGFVIESRKKLAVWIIYTYSLHSAMYCIFNIMCSVYSTL